MTEQEAIWVLKDFDKQVAAKADGAYQSTIGKMACDVAISALEEIQQYQALGTVKKLKVLKESALSGLELANIWAALEQLKKYEAIGTLEELREAREKQVPKKPKTILRHRGGFEMEHCPNCNTDYQVDRRYTINDDYCFACGKLLDSSFKRFCANCGQAIDWSN